MTGSEPPAEGPAPPEPRQIRPQSAVAVSVFLAAIAGFLTDWETAAAVFLATMAVFGVREAL